MLNLRTPLPLVILNVHKEELLVVVQQLVLFLFRVDLVQEIDKIVALVFGKQLELFVGDAVLPSLLRRDVLEGVDLAVVAAVRIPSPSCACDVPLPFHQNRVEAADDDRERQQLRQILLVAFAFSLLSDDAAELNLVLIEVGQTFHELLEFWFRPLPVADEDDVEIKLPHLLQKVAQLMVFVGDVRPLLQIVISLSEQL